MRASRGMGDINPAKEPKATTALKAGGKVNWIQKAIKKPGALHKELGVPAGKKIPSSKLAAATKKPGKMGKRARLAETMKGFKK